MEQYGMGGVQQPTKRNEAFVGNIAYDTPDELLKLVFSEIGRVMHVRMVTDKNTGKSKGYGFVEFSSNAEVLAAIDLMDGRFVAGREMRV
eukprot:CAMPEP_0119498650 /NCGR_PEP_ID=MMETSP1344-20130328/21350_1 /TAXON_ID=236787 /ORGANISM="Florenciella parvula, Strain CCMP2471" /LENGTH=89 /DNA_ID=CAMNT_0007534559 /DNA_START=74 /DNA_END=339 /DNA_ORIENTATION=+